MKKNDSSLNKLASSRIFRIKKTGKYIKGEILQIWFLDNSQGWQVLADKRTFKTAVLRNLAKRRLRELLRKNKIRKNTSGLIGFRNIQGLSRDFSVVENDYKNLIEKI